MQHGERKQRRKDHNGGLPQKEWIVRVALLEHAIHSLRGVKTHVKRDKLADGLVLALGLVVG